MARPAYEFSLGEEIDILEYSSRGMSPEDIGRELGYESRGVSVAVRKVIKQGSPTPHKCDPYKCAGCGYEIETTICVACEARMATQ